MFRILLFILYFTLARILYSKKQKQKKPSIVGKKVMCNVYVSMPHRTKKAYIEAYVW